MDTAGKNYSHAKVFIYIGNWFTETQICLEPVLKTTHMQLVVSLTVYSRAVCGVSELEQPIVQIF